MNTPVCDFAEAYSAGCPVRFHMPGHKGRGLIGPESLDLTEITGADELYRPEGILQKSEENASALFGSGMTLFSAEGSSQCIRAMVCLAALAWREESGASCTEKPLFLAGRNAHKSFLSAAALMDAEVEWLYPEEPEASICSCKITEDMLEKVLAGMKRKPCAVYITSPDYLGHLSDLKGLAQAAHRHGAFFLADNAHGAYLKFLNAGLHPLEAGADLCCDSAHKTLPALTGAAYLHIGKKALPRFAEYAKPAMEQFGSSSPSYLILQSLDRVNRLLAEGYPRKLADCAQEIREVKQRISRLGIEIEESDPLRITLLPGSIGYTGRETGEILEKAGIFCEYSDSDFLVLMVSPENPKEDYERLIAALDAIEHRSPRPRPGLPLPRPKRIIGIREASLMPFERIPAAKAEGRIAARSCVSCPPAVSVITGGEEVSADVIRICLYYGMNELAVIKGR